MAEQSRLRPAVFLDRDGTIAEEVGYLNHASRFRIFPFVAAAICRLNQANLPVIVVTNPSGVSRGYFPESLVHTVNGLMTRQLCRGRRQDRGDLILSAHDSRNLRVPQAKNWHAGARRTRACS